MDFQEVPPPAVLASVSKHAMQRVFLAMMALEHLVLHQIDVKTAFMNGDFKEIIFVDQPPDFGSWGQ